MEAAASVHDRRRKCSASAVSAVAVSYTVLSWMYTVNRAGAQAAPVWERQSRPLGAPPSSSTNRSQRRPREAAATAASRQWLDVEQPGSFGSLNSTSRRHLVWVDEIHGPASPRLGSDCS